MAQAAIAANIHEPLNVHLDFPAKVAFDDVLALNDFAQARHFNFRQIPHSRGGIDPNLVENGGARRIADAVDIGQADPNRLVSWNVNSGDTSHARPSFLLLALALLVLGVDADDTHDAAPLNDLAAFAAALHRS
jgi:hypothetical protein